MKRPRCQLLPALLLMLAARFRAGIMAMAAMLGIASFLLNVALIGSNPIATFYLPFTRAFELLTGAVLACGWINVNHASAASNWLTWDWMWEESQRPADN